MEQTVCESGEVATEMTREGVSNKRKDWLRKIVDRLNSMQGRGAHENGDSDIVRKRQESLEQTSRREGGSIEMKWERNE